MAKTPFNVGQERGTNPKGGRPPFEATPEMRVKVAIMASCGMPQPLICEQIINRQTGRPIDRVTLRKAFKEELATGKAQATALVAQSLFKKATGNGPQSVTAAIFWLKTQGGWKTTEALDVTGKDGAQQQEQTKGLRDFYA